MDERYFADMIAGMFERKVAEDGTVLVCFRDPEMQSMCTPWYEDVISGRETNLRDMVGNPLLDGDKVLNFNISKNGLLDGELCEVRLAHLPEYTYWTAGGAGIQTCSESVNFGVRRIRDGV